MSKSFDLGRLLSSCGSTNRTSASKLHERDAVSENHGKCYTSNGSLPKSCEKMQAARELCNSTNLNKSSFRCKAVAPFFRFVFYDFYVTDCDSYDHEALARHAIAGRNWVLDETVRAHTLNGKELFRHLKRTVTATNLRILMNAHECST